MRSPVTSVGAAALVAWAAAGVTQAAESWPMQGHDPARTGRSTVAGPGAMSLKWTYQEASEFTRCTKDNGNPVVGPDGSVYQSSLWAFLAINPDGTKRWESTENDEMFGAAPALSCDGSQVYVVGSSGLALELRARSALTGHLDWSLPIDSWQASQSYSSLAVGSDCAIYVAFLGWQGKDYWYPAVVAVNPDGTLRWRYENVALANRGIETPPAVAPNGTVYVLENHGGLVALGPSGAVLWRDLTFGQDYGWPTPMVGPDSSVYVAGENMGFQTKVVQAFRADGSVKWRREGLSSAAFYAGLALSADGKVLYRPSADGTLYALDTATGSTVWARRVTTDSLGGSPALSGNGILYVQGMGGGLYAVDAVNGHLLWSHQLDTPGFYFGPQSPAIGPDGTLHAVAAGSPGPAAPEPLTLYAFAPAPKPAGLLTVGGGGAGAGRVTSSPAGIDCGTDCSETYAPGTQVTLAATAAAGSVFTGWGGACTGAGACVVEIGQYKGVVANFTPTALPVLSVSDTSVSEGTGTGGWAQFTVTLSTASASTVTVKWATAAGTATAWTDFPLASGTVTLPPGITTATVSLQVAGDSTAEVDETFYFDLSGATNATIADARGVCTIVDDDEGTPVAVWHSWFAVDTLETPYVGDFDGDGKTDIITFARQNPSAVGDVYVALSDGTQFGANTKWHDWFAITTDETVVIGDYDGDGKDDIATWLGKTSRQVYVARSLGTGMTEESVWLGGIGTDSTDVLMSGDADGDGREDLVLFARKQGRVYVALSDGNGFGAPTVWHNFFAVSTYERPRVADVNGDARADIVTFATDSPTALGDVYVATSDGARFVDKNGAPNSSDKWHDWFAIRPTEQVRVGDLSGDGKDDFFTFLPPPYSQCYTVLSQGTSMAANVLWPATIGSDARDVPFVGDANGDGKADVIVFAQGEGKVYVSLAD